MESNEVTSSTNEEIADEIPNEVDTICYQSPEFLQKKLYFLLDHLKTMHGALPSKFQVRIPYDLLTSLANSLLNDTIFEIVKGLMEIQNVTEEHLFQLRQQVDKEIQVEIEEWKTKIKDPEELNNILELMKVKHSKRLRETDMKIVLHLDEKTKDQQTTLESAGVPGFYVTDNPQEIRIQMYLLEFILRLSEIKFET